MRELPYTVGLHNGLHMVFQMEGIIFNWRERETQVNTVHHIPLLQNSLLPFLLTEQSRVNQGNLSWSSIHIVLIIPWSHTVVLS